MTKTSGVECEEETFALKCYKYNALQGQNDISYVLHFIEFEEAKGFNVGFKEDWKIPPLLHSKKDLHTNELCQFFEYMFYILSKDY